MELSIIKLIRELRAKLKTTYAKKQKTIIKNKLEKLRPVITRKDPDKPKRNPVHMVEVDGEELTLSEIAKKYNLSLGTVKARYKAGNRGRLIARPSMRKPT